MLDARQDAATPAASGVSYNGGTPYRFQGRGARPCDGGAVPVVALGAGETCLVGDAGVQIGGLTIDCTAGVGTIDRFNAASAGEIRLTNGADRPLDGYVLPVAIGRMSGKANLRNWQVSVDGVPRRDVRLAATDEACLVLIGTGTRVYLR